jgi:hypothetical protein
MDKTPGDQTVTAGQGYEPLKYKIEAVSCETFKRRVKIKTYEDGWQEIYVDDTEIGTPDAVLGVAAALIDAAQHVRQMQSAYNNAHGSWPGGRDPFRA